MSATITTTGRAEPMPGLKGKGVLVTGPSVPRAADPQPLGSAKGALISLTLVPAQLVVMLLLRATGAGAYVLKPRG
jgi:hypothetical protein